MIAPRWHQADAELCWALEMMAMVSRLACCDAALLEGRLE
jgi:hypothetical protein